MKKILSLVMVIAMICALAVTTSAAEIPTDGLIGHFKLDGDLVNAVTGEAAIPMGKQFSEGMYEDDERTWYKGVDGSALAGSDGEGFNTLVNPGENFTIGIWVLETSSSGYTPYVWYGPQDQGTTGFFGGETWLGIWNVNVANGWTTDGLTFGSNNPAGGRPEIVPADEAGIYDKEAEIYLQWTHAVITGTKVEADDGSSTLTVKMYINGVEVGTVEGAPNPYTGDVETYNDYVYVNGVNAWADNMSNGALDEVVIYDKAMTADEVAALYASYAAPAQYDTLDAFWADMVVTEEEPVETEAPETEAPETEAPETEAPVADTEAPTTDTEAPAEEGGCGSSMGAAALVALVATLGCAIVKKH